MEGYRERVGSCLRWRTSCPLYLLYKIFFLKFTQYSLLIIYGPVLPPRLRAEPPQVKHPLQRGCRLIYTRNILRVETLICLLEVGRLILEHCVVDLMDR